MQAEGAFAKLLAPFRVEDFFRDYWETASLHVRRHHPEDYRDILTVEMLDQYFQAGNLAPHFLRLVKSGVDCSLDDWTTIDKRKNTEPYRVVVPDKVLSLFADGATININAAQTAITGLARWCAELEKALEISIQPNIYITPPGARGFGYHFDAHDVFIMQISGNKQWRLYDYPIKLPVSIETLEEGDYENRTPKRTVEMQEGDLLYLPRGTVHSANTANEASIHITLALMPRYWFNLIEELALVARNDEAFRRALPHGFSNPNERAVSIQRFRQGLQDLVARVEIETLLQSSRADSRSNQQADKRGRFSDFILLNHLNLDSVVSLRAGIDYRIETGADNLTVKFSERELSLPCFMADTLDSLLGIQPYPVRALRGLVSDAGKLELVSRFVREGLLKIERV